jgi:hypothetical protein
MSAALVAQRCTQGTFVKRIMMVISMEKENLQSSWFEDQPWCF